MDPAALRIVHLTLAVVSGVGLACALGGVLFYQLSKDEEALRKGREVRRKRWGYLEEQIGGKRSEHDEHHPKRFDQQRIDRERAAERGG